MPTVRSDFTYQQYEKALQALAYKLALDAIRQMNNKEAKFRTSGKEMEEIQTDTWHIRFYSKHVSFSPGRMKKWTGYGEGTYFSAEWGCQVEEKLYTDSPHSSKIHFDVNQGEDEMKKRKLILEFLNMLMKDIKPAQRFVLAQLPTPKPVLSPQEKYQTLRSMGKIS